VLSIARAARRCSRDRHLPRWNGDALMLTRMSAPPSRVCERAGPFEYQMSSQMETPMPTPESENTVVPVPPRNSGLRRRRVVGQEYLAVRSRHLAAGDDRRGVPDVLADFDEADHRGAVQCGLGVGNPCQAFRVLA
jgi:hypothetical protein